MAALDADDGRPGQGGRGRQEGLRRLRTAGQTLGVIGLGKIGCLVADAAIKLGMHVLGYDPEITVDAAWSLPSQVQARGQRGRGAAQQRTSSRCTCRWSTATRDLVNADNIGLMRAGAVLLNFSREGVVDDAAVLAALDGQRLGHYVCDFPSAGAATATRAWSRCRTWAPPRARPRRTAP